MSETRSSCSTVRLQRDLVEVLTNPVEGFEVYLPDEGSILTQWVIRYEVHEGLLANQHFYFELRFGAQYPAVPPELRSLTFIPHISMHAVTCDICLTMLTTTSSSRRYFGWVPSFSALSIIRQMQSFFHDSYLTVNEPAEELQLIASRVLALEQGPLKSMKLERLAYKKLYYEVPLVVEESILDSPVPNVDTVVKNEIVDSNSISIDQHDEQDEQDMWNIVSKKCQQKPKAGARQQTNKLHSKKQPQHATTAITKATTAAQEIKASSAATAPVENPTSSKIPTYSSIVAKSIASSPAPVAPSSYSSLSSSSSSKQLSSLKTGPAFSAKASAGSSLPQDSANRTSGLKAPAAIVRAVDKLGSKKRNNIFALLSEEVDVDGSAAIDEPNPEKSHSRHHQGMSPLVASAIPCNAIISSAEDASAISRLPKDSTAMMTESMLRSASNFSKLSSCLLQQILLFCEPNDIARAMASCKFLHSTCIDGHIWKAMIDRHFPSCSMIPANTQDARVGLCWRQIWLMEANGARYSELQCFYSKRTIAEDVLGIPLYFTVNPKTGLVDYIYSSMELMSMTSYDVAGVRKNMWGETINGFMPLYLTQEHFRRSLSRIQQSILRLSQQDHRATSQARAGAGSRFLDSQRQPEKRTAPQTFSPSMVLQVLPRMMNTMVVLLADQGIDELERCIHGYCQLHRLLIALIREYPSLQQDIANRFRRFISQSVYRSKTYEPNLGELIVLVSVCEEIGWKDIISILTQESFARSILWACRDSPRLAYLAKNTRICYPLSSTASMNIQEQVGIFPDSLLDEIMTLSHTRHSLYSFHCAFLRVVGCNPAGASLSKLERLHDRTLGLPPRHVKQQLLAVVERQAQCQQSWDWYFESICMCKVSNDHLKQMWLSSIRRSFALGYHSQTTDFGRIQSRGVSNILLRGKSYGRVVFCIDVSGSMGIYCSDPVTHQSVSRLDFVKEELSVIIREKLTTRNQFTLIAFNTSAYSWSRDLQQATASNVSSAIAAVQGWDSDGGTSFYCALDAAFNVPGVEEIYFLSDGEDSSAESAAFTENIKRWSKNGSIPCHTTSFFAPESGKQLLRRIALITGGNFVDFQDSARSTS